MEPQKNDGVVNLVPPNVTANSVPPPYVRPSAEIISNIPQSLPPVASPTSFNNLPPQKSHKVLIFAILLIILLLLGSVGYLYMAKVGPFSLKPYSEDTFFSEVSKKIEIDVPKDATPIDSSISSYSENLEVSQMKTDDEAIKSSISSVRAAAELYYDFKNSYGNFSLGPCKKTAGTVFADSYVSQSLDSATYYNVSSATCVAKSTSYAISVPLPSDKTYSWCVDSQGNAKQIMGAIKGDVCK